MTLLSWEEGAHQLRYLVEQLNAPNDPERLADAAWCGDLARVEGFVARHGEGTSDHESATRLARSCLGWAFGAHTRVQEMLVRGTGDNRWSLTEVAEYTAIA
jgi:hypothetical protein